MDNCDLFRKILVPLQNSTIQLEKLKQKSKEGKFINYADYFVQVLNKKIQEAQEQIDFLQKYLVTDHLVIAFFGETNAGKSTIVDTFRCLFNEPTRAKLLSQFQKENPESEGLGVDGTIVGDGRSDFTQTYDEYTMSIQSKKFTLIDVPGIEGNESEYTEGIAKALQKAHCVFYVHGHDVKPNTKTAEKIKQYLNDWVRVYSICNIRGGSENYDEEEERETLLTDNVKRSTELTQTEFKSILGNSYQDNIVLQGLLALCSSAKFSPTRPDLIKTQKDLEEYFSDLNSVYKFSNFESIVQIVNKMSETYTEIIEMSNKTKVIALAKKVLQDLNSCIQTNQESLAKFQDRLEKFQLGVKNAKNQAINNIDFEYVVDDAIEDLRHKLYDAVDTGDRDLIQQVSEEGSDQLQMDISACIKNMCRTTYNDFLREVNRLKKDLDTNLKMFSDEVDADIWVNVNTNAILDELQTFDFNGGFGTAISVASLAWAIPGVGWIIGGIATVGALLFRGFLLHDHGRAKAKQAIDEKLAEAKTSIMEQLEFQQSEVEDIYKNAYAGYHSMIKKEILYIKDLKSEIENLKLEMKETIIKMRKA